MKYFPVVWAGLWRSPARSILTLCSIVVAFLLFGLLQGLNAGFDKAIADQALDILITDLRVPGGAPMPIAALPRIESVPGVTEVTPRATFFGWYREPKNLVLLLAFDIKKWAQMRPGMAITREHLAAMRRTRTGMIVTPALQKYYGWKIGDRIPFRSEALRQDGTADWAFDLVGTFDDAARPTQAYLAVINYSYFDAARAANRGTADRFLVRIADPNRSVETAEAIDRLFANSDHESRTRSEKEIAQSRLTQIGDFRFVTNGIVAAVFFTLLFITANTMRQSIRERVPEFAILKTIGFSDAQIFTFALMEALALCLVSAAVGLVLAAAAAPLMRDVIGPVRTSGFVIASGIGTAAIVALASAWLPAWRVGKLSVVDALADR